MKTLLLAAALTLTALSLVPGAAAETPGPCGVGPQRCPAPHFPDVRDLLPTDVPYCITVDCTPIADLVAPPSACDLQEATPTGVGAANPRHLVWGAYDPQECDVDVDPIGACAPPSGHTVERRVAFVHLTLLVCDGGVDPPVWS